MRGESKLILDFLCLIPPAPTFPSGTRCLFDQDEPPTGWIRDTNSALDDRCLRIVIGARVDGGSWTISGLSGDSHDHVYNDNPLHGHSASGSSHSHSLQGRTDSGTAYPGKTEGIASTDGNTSSNAPAVSPSAEGVPSPSTGLASETISSDGLWRPAYRDVIVAEKE